MPKNRAQGVIFGILMSVTMAYGMEIYNVAWKMGIPLQPGGFSNMTNDVFLGALLEAAYMWLFVFLFSNLWGSRLGAGLSSQLPAIWVGTVIENFPMALLWNLFAAGPASRLVFRTCFAHVGEKREAAAAAPERA